MTGHTEQHEAGELLPCPNPWCIPSETFVPTLIWRGSEAVIECASCGMQGPGVSPVLRDEDGEWVGTQDAESLAITAWNTRTSTPNTEPAGGWQQEQVEAVARAMCDHTRELTRYDDLDDHNRKFWRDHAQAVLEALAALAQPTGEQPEAAATKALLYIRSELALFAACCAVSNKVNDTFVGTEAKAKEWVAYINAAIASGEQP